MEPFSIFLICDIWSPSLSGCYDRRATVGVPLPVCLRPSQRPFASAFLSFCLLLVLFVPLVVLLDESSSGK